MQLIFVHGGNAKTAQLAINNGWLYGVRGDYKPYSSVFMFDYNWKQAYTTKRWQNYLDKISEHKPYMAMAPDFETPDQWPQLKQQIIDIKRAGAKYIMITPKFDGAMGFIPSWDVFVIAVSVPTQYAGFLPLPSDVSNRKLHLLGGSPDQWQYLRNIYESSGATVISADSNFAWMQAYRFGKYWSSDNNGRYIEMRGKGLTSEELAAASLQNTRDYMSKKINNSNLYVGRRIRSCQTQLSRQLKLL